MATRAELERELAELEARVTAAKARARPPARVAPRAVRGAVSPRARLERELEGLTAALAQAHGRPAPRGSDDAQTAARRAAGLPNPAAPLCVAYGMGVDSTAMLVGLHARGVRPDLITFADTGGEKPETYAYFEVIQRWLAAVGFPPLVVVRYRPKHGLYTTLEENCLVNGMLPSISYFGKKGCSLKWKRGPQNAYRRAWAPARAWWKAGGRVTVLIGYDAGPKDARRSEVADDAEYIYGYPLRVWGWSRERCQAEIAAAGLPVPVKSACWFCLANKPAEIAALDDAHPEIGDRIMAMEANAAPNLRTVGGLWGTACKGMRGAVAHPAAMGDFLRERRARRSLPVVVDDGAMPDCGGY